MYTGIPYNCDIMNTVIETPIFKKQVDQLWSEDERLDFIQWLAKHPEYGQIIPKAEGVRKVRWSVQESGKRGGVRIIYFYKAEDGLIYLIAIYKKSKQENMPAHEIKKRWNDEH